MCGGVGSAPLESINPVQSEKGGDYCLVLVNVCVYGSSQNGSLVEEFDLGKMVMP